MSDELAINGGPRVRQRPYPPWPVLGDEDVEAAAAVMRSGGLTQLTGGAVAAFEEAVAAWHGARHCVAVSSGTTAIHAALIALDVGPGDEVIVPAHTFIASATPVLHQGATPVFADIDEQTFCISPVSVAERTTERTKAIVAVHLNGHPADMEALLELAPPRGIAVIEDAAQAHGAEVRGGGRRSEVGGKRGKWRKVGTMGRVGCFSFWEDKIITTGGEGGCVITDDDRLAERLRRIRHHGEGPMEAVRTGGLPPERAYFHLELGYNYRMTSMQAATGLVQLRRLDEYLEGRRRNAAYLSERLGEVEGIQPPFVAEGVVHSYYKYICRLRPETGIPIAEFVRAVAAEGIPISRRYPTPLPRQPVFQGINSEPEGTEPHAGSCPNAERLAGELFTLLVHPTVGTRDLDDVVEAVRKVIRGMGA